MGWAGVRVVSAERQPQGPKASHHHESLLLRALMCHQGTGWQVEAGADRSRSPPLLSDVRAVTREAFSLFVTAHLCWLQTRLLLH